MHVAMELFFYSSICSSIALVFGLEAWSWTQRRRNERGRRHFPLRPFERFHSSSPPRARPRHRHHHYDGLRVPPTVTATTIHNHTASPPLPTSVSCLSALIAPSPCYYFSSDPPETRLLLAGGTQRFGPSFVRRGLDSFPVAAPPISLPPSLSKSARVFRPQSARVLSRVARAGVEENSELIKGSWCLPVLGGTTTTSAAAFGASSESILSSRSCFGHGELPEESPVALLPALVPGGVRAVRVPKPRRYRNGGLDCYFSTLT